jgi:hypothetical protein
MPDTQILIFFLTTRIDLLPFQKLTCIFLAYTYSACYLLCEQQCSIDMCPVSIGAFCRALYAARHLKEEEPNERAHTLQYGNQAELHRLSISSDIAFSVFMRSQDPLPKLPRLLPSPHSIFPTPPKCGSLTPPLPHHPTHLPCMP